MQAAADDLNVKLVIRYVSTGNSAMFKKLGDQLLDSKPRIDFLLTKYVESITATHIKRAKTRGIGVFVFNSDIPASEYSTVGRLPREKYSNWIGHLVPNDRQAGYDLAQALIDRSIQLKGPDHGAIHVLALDSPYESTVGMNRRAGLLAKIRETPDAELQDIVITNWGRGSSITRKMVKLMQRYQNTDVIWSPNEAITRSAVQTMEQFGRIPGKNVVIGGFDWNPENIRAIVDGRISALMFGHFLEGAWALILTHDYYYGFDFADDPGIRVDTPLFVLNADNYPQYRKLLQGDDWGKIDFRKFSKKYNDHLDKYNFDIRQFLIQFHD